jgi:hypothetical protein
MLQDEMTEMTLLLQHNAQQLEWENVCILCDAGASAPPQAEPEIMPLLESAPTPTPTPTPATAPDSELERLRIRMQEQEQQIIRFSQEIGSLLSQTTKQAEIIAKTRSAHGRRELQASHDVW